MRKTKVFSSFIKKNRLEIILFALSLIAAFILYLYSMKEREPIFLVDPIRTEILRRQDLDESPIKVLRNDSTRIMTDLTVAKVYFWNNGRESIKREHILENLMIEFDDSTNQILDFKLLKVSRAITGIRVQRDSVKMQKRLCVDFNILEDDDGFSAQIIFSGNQNTRIRLLGIIEGAKNIRFSPPATLFWMKQLVRILEIMLLGLILIVLSRKAKSFSEKIKNKKLHHSSSRFQRIYYSIVAEIGFIIIFMLFVIAFNLILSDVPSKATAFVPEEILEE